MDTYWQFITRQRRIAIVGICVSLTLFLLMSASLFLALPYEHALGVGVVLMFTLWLLCNRGHIDDTKYLDTPGTLTPWELCRAISTIQEKGWLPKRCEILVTKNGRRVPSVRSSGFLYREHSELILPLRDRALSQPMAPEAIVLHEVGHMINWWTGRNAPLISLSVGFISTVMGLNGTVVVLLMTLMNTSPEQTFGSAVSTLTWLLGAVISGLLLRKTAHASEYIADSHALLTLGRRGAHGLIITLTTYVLYQCVDARQSSRMHPAPNARIRALEQYLSEQKST